MTAPVGIIPPKKQPLTARIAQLFGLSPDQGEAPSGHAPAPMNTSAIRAAMEDWLHRGGEVSPSDPLAEYATKLPNGQLVGGEFNDEETAAYQDAEGKLRTAERDERLAPLIAAAMARSKQKPDALAGTDRPTSGENPVTIAEDLLTAISPTMPKADKAALMISNRPRGGR